MGDQQKPVGHRAIVNGKPASGKTSMGFKCPGGRPANQPPKGNLYYGGQQQQTE
jgi:hypothetical protein